MNKDWRVSHGESKSRTYRSWIAMNSRCHNPNSTTYYKYGAKGIKVCLRWRHSFPNFLADMGIRPEGKSIDRIDNSKGYTKSNCRWATPSEQAKNRRLIFTLAARKELSRKAKESKFWLHQARLK